MTDRPTPEQIAQRLDDEWQLGDGSRARHLLSDLTMAGYVIVHPDDVPRQSYEGPFGRRWAQGYNQARLDILDPKEQP